MNMIYRWFENWIDPLQDFDGKRPPQTTMRFLMHYMYQARWPLLLALFVGGILPLLEAGLFYFTGRIVDILDQSAVERSWHGLYVSAGTELLLMGFIVLIVRVLMTALSSLLDDQTITPGFYNMIRWQANSYVLRQSYAFFQNDFSGRIATKVWQAGQAAGDLITSFIQVVWFMLIYSVTTLLLFGQLDWRLAALVVVWMVLFAWIARLYLPKMRKQAEASAEAGSLINGRIVDSYTNIQTIKLNTPDMDQAYLRSGFNSYITTMLPFMRTLTGMRVAMTALSSLMIVLVAVFSIDLWTKGQATVGEVAFTLGLVLRMNMLLGRLMMQMNGMLRSYGVIENSMRLISAPLGMEDKPDAKPLTVTSGAIDIDHVTFRYGSENENKEKVGVLSDISLSVRGGERIGLIGHSGAGKTTLINLMLRLYDVDEGAVRIDGQDVRDVTQSSLRAAFAVVSQETALLHRSLRDNIMLAKADASEEELRFAASQAEAEEFIGALEDYKGRKAYDAFVGERGVKLSGGQRQRISIARAVLKNAPILILDEATSALDSEVEAAIQENLTKLMTGKTVIAIAHRLSTIAQLDRLVVLDRGRIAESGTHNELVARGGIYAGLWARQSGGFLGEAEAEA